MSTGSQRQCRDEHDQDDSLTDTVLARATADPGLTEESKLLILAALSSDDDLADAIEAPRSSLTPRSLSTSDPVRAFLSSVTVQGFRGIGPASTLTLTPAPGLTLIAGRNGSGKSSFAEALEVLLTRNSYRWQHRSAVWRESWRNLRHPCPVSIVLEVAQEGAEPATVGAEWQDNAALNEGSWWVQTRGSKRQPSLDALGWDEHLETFRPFLAYDELGPLFAEPSKLHDAMAPILGLDRLADAQRRLAETQKMISEPTTAAARCARELRPLLSASRDERAAAALTEIASSRPDLGAVRALATGADSENGGDLVLQP